jgi:hypothetical protein
MVIDISKWTGSIDKFALLYVHLTSLTILCDPLRESNYLFGLSLLLKNSLIFFFFVYMIVYFLFLLNQKWELCSPIIFFLFNLKKMKRENFNIKLHVRGVFDLNNMWIKGINLSYQINIMPPEFPRP